MRFRVRIRQVLTVLGLGAALIAPVAATAQSDDTALFASTTVNPNVMIVLDNSVSMNHVIWHQDFDPTQDPTCNAFVNDAIYGYNNDEKDATFCGRTHDIFTDNDAVGDTLFTGRYLNWLFSPESDAAWTEIVKTNNGFPSGCVGGTSFAKYMRTRLSVAKQVLKDVVCQVNLVKDVRFGISQFRDSGFGDPNGGYVLAEIEDYNDNQANLIAAIQSVRAETDAPLAETLFQVYTYLMSRTLADLPAGDDPTKKFPVYAYNTSKSSPGGLFEASPAKYLPDPVEYSCQKNFVVIISDGGATMDDFTPAAPADTGQGFGDFMALIGDYNPDGEVENQPDLICAGCQTSLFLDDVAHFMQQNDFRPDLSDDQVIDTYTVGLGASGPGAALLSKTADVGNGLFFQSNDPDSLAAALLDALTDIIEKSQSFTAATVPASRTAAGEHLYVSIFTPLGKSPYWEGHLRSYRITAAGEIHDKNGACALDDPSGNCFSGPLLLPDERPPFWDAGEEIPAPGSRKLYTSRLTGVPGTSQRVSFRHTSDTPAGPLTAADLGVTFPPTAPYSGSVAATDEELTAEIIANVRGCEFGTGANGVPCVSRPWPLSDIFHSDPVVVGQPAIYDSDPSFKQFQADHAGRDRVIYAGSNGGFLHGFDAGAWDGAGPGTGYDAGTGEELFGFMPWSSRQVAKDLPHDGGNRDYYFVDGSPSVVDAWLYTNPSVAAKQASGVEWRTILVGGLRQGGESYYALDISKPGGVGCVSPATGSGYPCYLWEFPREDSELAPLSQDYKNDMGETWSEPILTKVRVKVGANDNGGKGFERYVAIFTGGYHPSGNPNDHAAYDPTASKGRSIWILDLKTGEPLAVRRFDTSGDCTDPANYDPLNPEADMCYAIASTPGVYDTNNDGYADVIFVGDLGGNVWKWVIEGLGEDRVNDGSGVLSQPSWPFRKFFQAPIYQEKHFDPEFFKSFFFPPAATFKSGTLWLALGSGERTDLLFEGDITLTADNNRFYAMTDLDPHDRIDPAPSVLTEGDLLDVSADATCADVAAFRGYYFVADEAEKFVTDVDVFSHFVLMSSYVPLLSLDPCEIGGEAFLYLFRIYCGEGFFLDGGGDPERSVTTGAGLPSDPRISIDVGGGGANRVIVSKQGGDIINLEAPPTPGAGIGLFYWRELR